MKPHLSVVTFSLLSLALCIVPAETSACDHCGQISCTATSSTCCDNQGILDRSAHMLGSMRHRAKSLFGLKRRQASCDTCGQPDCGCEIETGCGVELSGGSCGCSSCTGEPSPSFKRENLLSRLFAKKSSRCDTGPSCGCESYSECNCQEVAPLPSCGCETTPCGCDDGPGGLLGKLFHKQNDRGCETVVDCGCEVVPCGCDDGPGGLLGRLFDRHVDQGCDPIEACGCDSPSLLKRRPFFQPSCEPPKPNIFERMLQKHGVRSCDMIADCGCELGTPCGCDSAGPARGGLLDRLFHKTAASCDAEPTCGCAAPADCGCETNFTDSSCGCEMSVGSGLHCPHCQGGVAPHGSPTSPHVHHGEVPPQAVPMHAHPHEHVHAAPPQPQMQPLQNPPTIAKPEVEAEPAPAPAPPTTRTPLRNAQPAPIPARPKAGSAIPDEDVNPFQDDSANRVRRLPTEAIRFESKSDSESYGRAYDPQASNAVQFRFSDMENDRPEPLRMAAGHAQPLESFSQDSSSRLVPASAQSVRALPVSAQQANHIERRLRLR